MAEAEIQVLLWSQRQNCLHVEPLSLMYERNRGRMVTDQPGDYVPIVAGSRGEVDSMADKLRPMLAVRDRSRREAA